MVTPPMRLERHSAQAEHGHGHQRDPEPQQLVVGEGDNGRGDQHRDQVHHLDQRVQGRAGGVLERVADGVADHGRLVGLGVLAAVVAVLDVLLGVVPGAAGHRQHDRQQLPGQDGAGQVGAEGGRLEQEPGGDRGQHRQQPRGQQLAQRVPGADVDHGAVVGALGRRSMIPGCSRNCLRTSNTTRPAARPTARIAWAENMNATDPPISRPTRTLGLLDRDVDVLEGQRRRRAGPGGTSRTGWSRPARRWRWPRPW